MTDQAQAIRPGEELPQAALEAYLQALWGNDFRLHHIRQFPGGYSNLTYLLNTSQGELVLRRPPLGAAIKSAHDMGREYQVLSLLQPLYPQAPQPLHHCADTSLIGGPFFLMERVHGLILRPGRPEAQALSPSQWQALSQASLDQLASLHQLDLSGPLGQLGKPEGYVQRQVTGWVGRYERARTHDLPALDTVAAWMQAHLPPATAPAFLHNDYKYDNLVLDPHNPGHIRAILDWEMATTGDPLMDLGTSLAYWVEASDAPTLRRFNLTHHPGNLTRREAVDYYAQRSGRDVSHVLFYYVFGCYKLAVIIQQIYARYVAGHTQDPRFKDLGDIVAAVATQAAHALETDRLGA